VGEISTTRKVAKKTVEFSHIVLRPVEKQLKLAAGVVGLTGAVLAVRYIGANVDPIVRGMNHLVGDVMSDANLGRMYMTVGFGTAKAPQAASAAYKLLRGRKQGIIPDTFGGKLKEIGYVATVVAANIYAAPWMQTALRGTNPLNHMPLSDWAVSTTYFVTGLAIGLLAKSTLSGLD